jgi:hypothetical protein
MGVQMAKAFKCESGGTCGRLPQPFAVPTLLGVALSLLISSSSHAATLSISSLGTTPSVYEPAEWVVLSAKQYANPYDPREISIDATLISPAGEHLSVPAYWAADRFKVRFAPDRPGKWTIGVTAVDSTGSQTLLPQVFDVAAGNHPGFVRVADNHHYLRRENAGSFFPVGIDLAWAPHGQGAQWFDSTFATFAANGGNFARVWLCADAVQIETAKTGLGVYDESNLALFDQILASADRHGIAVMLCLMNHREWIDHDMWGSAGWPKNAYNADNGGPATRPSDFFHSEVCKQHYKARLRYLVARYSAFSSLAFWELFNEQEFTRTPVPVEWNAEMASYIQQIDPAHHLITTSATVPDEVWKLPAMAVTQSHLYGDGVQPDMVGPITSSASDHEGFNKPHFIGEFGIDAARSDEHYDPTGLGTALHNSLWSSTFSGCAGTAMNWWWDSYIEPKKLWHEFEPIAQFTKSSDWAGNNFVPIEGVILRRESGDGLVDMVIPSAGGWGTIAREPITVPANGRPAKMPPSFLCGPAHHELYAPVLLDVNLPVATRPALSFERVSDYAVLRVSVDGEPKADFTFSALPGSPDAQAIDPHRHEQSNVAELNRTQSFAVDLPAGKHRIKLDVVAGDWVVLSSITFPEAMDARFANLDARVLQDPHSHEALAWIWDVRSNWKADQSGAEFTPVSGIELTVPNVVAGIYQAQWWDTRAGIVIRTDQVTAKDQRVVLQAPPFSRDIAVHLLASHLTKTSGR